MPGTSPKAASGLFRPGLQPLPASTAIALLNFLACYFRVFLFPNVPLVEWGDQIGFFNGGVRIASGQIPFRDYFQFVPPGTDYFYASLVKLFGPRIWIPNLVMALLAGIAGLLITLIAARILNGFSMLLPGLLLAGFMVPAAIDATHHWFSTIAILAALLVMLDRRTLWHVAAAGALCGLAATFTQTKGAMCLAAFVVFLMASGERNAATGGTDRRKLILVLLSAGAGTFILLNAWTVWAAGFSRWLYCVLVFPARYYSGPAINNWRVIFYDIRNHLGIMTRITFPFVYATVPFVAIIALFAERRWKEGDDHVREKVRLLAITGIALFLSVASSPSAKRMAALSPPALILIAWLLSYPGKLMARTRILLAWIALILAIGPPARLQAHSYPTLNLPAGRAAFQDQALYVEYQWFLNHTYPGEFVFGLPPLDTAFLLRNPSAIEGIHASEYSRPEQIGELVESLETHQVPMLVLRDSAEYLWGRESVHDHLGPLRLYVRDHYAMTTRFSTGDEVWERIPGSASGGTAPRAVALIGPGEMKGGPDSARRP